MRGSIRGLWLAVAVLATVAVPGGAVSGEAAGGSATETDPRFGISCVGG